MKDVLVLVKINGNMGVVTFSQKLPKNEAKKIIRSLKSEYDLQYVDTVPIRKFGRIPGKTITISLSKLLNTNPHPHQTQQESQQQITHEL